YLHAQTHALDFYRRHGFVAEGPEFVDAGITHRTMRLVLRTARILGVDAGRFAVHDRADIALDMARHSGRQLRLLANTLDPALFGTASFAAALSQLARRSRYSDVRLLVLEARPLAERSHKLLELHRRLSSAVQLRRAD